jgi:hypothetical protein
MSWSVSGGTITNPPSSGTPKAQCVYYVDHQWYSIISHKQSRGKCLKERECFGYVIGGNSIEHVTDHYLQRYPLTLSTQAHQRAAAIAPPSYSYQWQQSTDNVNFSDISGQTSLSLTFSAPLTITTYYRRKVTETVSGSVAYSNSATVTVMPQLYPNTVMPGTQDIFIGTDASNLSIPPASGGNCSGNYIYSWEFSSDNISFGPSGLGTANGLVPGSPNSTIYYRRKVVCGTESQYSNAAAIFVHAHLSAGNISSGSITITYNTSPGLLTDDCLGWYLCLLFISMVSKCRQY